MKLGNSLYLITGILLILFSFAVSAPNDRIYGKTYFDNDRAIVEDFGGIVEQYPITINQGETARLKFQNKKGNSKWEVCFDFKGNEDRVVIESFEERKFLGLFNENKKDRKNDNGLICMKNIDVEDTKEFDFKLKYLNDGVLKYDVILKQGKERIVLDPYLVGNLTNNSEVMVYMPLNETLDNVYYDYLYTNNLSNTTENITTSVSFILAKTFVVNNYVLRGQNEVKCTGACGSSNAYRYKFNYQDGTSENIDAYTSSTSYVPKNYTNPYPSKRVTTIQIYNSVNSLNTNGGIRNDEVIITSPPTWYYLFFKEGINEYGFYTENNSNDLRFITDGVDTSITYNDTGANFDGTSSAIVFANNSINLSQGSVYLRAVKSEITDSTKRRIISAEYDANEGAYLYVQNGILYANLSNSSAECYLVGAQNITETETDITWLWNTTHCSIYTNLVQQDLATWT